MGVILMAKSPKYKSIGVNTDTYEKVVHMAHVERRNISTQLAILVDEAYDKMMSLQFERKQINENKVWNKFLEK